MKKKLMIGLSVILGLAMSAMGQEVQLLRVQQRYPWNGLVDIDYEITGDAEGLQLGITAIDEMTHVAYPAVKGFPYALPVTAGKHRVTWNTAADSAIMYSTNVTFKAELKRPVNPPLYAVVDLSLGPDADSWGISYLDAVPSGGWTDEYKTTKLVLRRIEPGSFTMTGGGAHQVTITRPFYIGVFEVTADQMLKICEKNTPFVSYDDIRGAIKGAGWPSTADVDEDSIIGRMRAKTGRAGFDLPTEAQWEYACRAGTTSDLNVEGRSVDEIAMYLLNSATENKTRDSEWSSWCYTYYYTNLKPPTSFGSKIPNAWGLYDCLGNIKEWCLDWFAENVAERVDQVGVNGSLGWRVLRGGSYASYPVTSSSRNKCAPSSIGTTSVPCAAQKATDHQDSGFRLCYHGEL